MNKYTPELTKEQRLVYAERFADIERNLKPLCKWVDFYDYLWSYSSLNYTDKVVLDIGADVGSSAIFFLLSGAKKVYMVENNPNYIKEYKRLKEIGYLNGILNNTELIDASDINNINFDILKMDCEGCELDLLTSTLLDKAKEFVVAIHSLDILEDSQESKNSIYLDYDRKQNYESLIFFLKGAVDVLSNKYGGHYFGNVNDKEFVFIKKVD